MAKTPQHGEEEVSESHALVKHAQDNPMLYIAGGVIVVIVLIATLLIQLNNNIKTKEQASVFAAALDIDDPMERMVALGEVIESSSKFDAQALYMQGFAALDAEDYETARTALTKLREDHPDFEFTPDGVEGLGAILEAQEDFTAAIAVYQDVQASWPDSFAARRQPLNIARCYEESDNFEEAVKFYQEQLLVFPGSNVAMHAQQKLDELRSSQPEVAAATPETPEVISVEDAIN